MWFLKSPAERWKEAALASHIRASEGLVGALAAFSGLLGHPLLSIGPWLWGSTLWEVALTDQRFIALERRLFGRQRHRKTISIEIADIRRLDVHWNWGIQANVRLATNANAYEFKVWGFPRATYRFISELRRIAQGIAERPLTDG